MSSDTDLVLGLIAKEDALLLLITTWVYSRDPTRVTSSCIDSKCAIDIAPSLVELNRLPGVLGRLADSRATFDHDLTAWLGLIAVLLMHITLDLILAKAEGQIKFESLIRILSAMRLLKARCIRIHRVSRAAISCTSWILRPMVVG